MMNVQRVLIFRIGSVGDTVVALPSLRWVTNNYPGARRYLLTNFTQHEKAAATAEVLDGMGLVDEYIEYPISLRNPVVLAQLAKRIRKLRPDVLVYLTEPRGLIKTIRDAIYFKCCGIPKLIGVPYKRNLRMPLPIEADLVENEAARLARCIGARFEETVHSNAAFDLSLTDADRAAASRALQQLGHDRPMLAVSIGAKVDVKDWGSDNWASLMRELRSLLPSWNLVVVGVASERRVSDALLEAWGGQGINLCGALGVRESAAVLERTQLFIGHDSGPMHLASAVGTSCVAIFSSRNFPGEWYPNGQGHEVIYHRVPCQGCRLATCRKYEKRCIASIEVSEVIDAVERVLRSREDIADGRPTPTIGPD